RLDLILLLLLRVGDLEIDLPLGGFLFGDRGLGSPPAGFRSDLGKTDGELGGTGGLREEQGGIRCGGREKSFESHKGVPPKCCPGTTTRFLVSKYLRAGRCEQHRDYFTEGWEQLVILFDYSPAGEPDIANAL